MTCLENMMYTSKENGNNNGWFQINLFWLFETGRESAQGKLIPGHGCTINCEFGIKSARSWVGGWGKEREIIV